MKKILFLTGKTNLYNEPYHYYNETLEAINLGFDSIITTNLDLLSFYLFEQGFNKIELIHNEIIYDLKLGKNSWIEKDLRLSHNLYKLVKSNILC